MKARIVVENQRRTKATRRFLSVKVRTWRGNKVFAIFQSRLRDQKKMIARLKALPPPPSRLIDLGTNLIQRGATIVVSYGRILYERHGASRTEMFLRSQSRMKKWCCLEGQCLKSSGSIIDCVARHTGGSGRCCKSMTRRGRNPGKATATSPSRLRPPSVFGSRVQVLPSCCCNHTESLIPRFAAAILGSIFLHLRNTSCNHHMLHGTNRASSSIPASGGPGRDEVPL